MSVKIEENRKNREHSHFLSAVSLRCAMKRVEVTFLKQLETEKTLLDVKILNITVMNTKTMRVSTSPYSDKKQNSAL